MPSKAAERLASGQTGFRPDYETVASESRRSTIQKRLIVCCDGTWFASDKGTQNLPSNVARIGRLIASEGEAITNVSNKEPEVVAVPQIVYYQSGVGTGHLTWVDKRIQGAFGDSLDENVCSAYNFLCNNYSAGDEIFLFGFSRGAYTARALAGLILGVGFIPPGSMTEFYSMYAAYKKKEPGTRFQTSDWWKKNAKPLNISHENVSIKFIGVWDTVGSLGLPDSYLTQISNWNKGHQFHDTEMAERIQKAAHALALDEYRGTFSPTIWYHKGRDQGWAAELIQCWFPGYHSHIGGGTVEKLVDESSIDDITLAWMVDQTRDFLTYDKGEIDNFVEQQRVAEHKWGEGCLTDSASYAYMAPGAGGLKTRTPGQYNMAIPEERKMKKNDPKPEYYETSEYIHPSVRYRSGWMKEKPGKLGMAPGWFGSQHQIEKYEPAALKGFIPSIQDDGSYNNNYQWKKPAQKKEEKDEVVIDEYRIPPEWSYGSCEGLERRIVPPAIMKELDEANNYGAEGPIRSPPPATNHGFQPPTF